MDEARPEHKPHEKLLTFVEDRKGHDWRYAINSVKIMKDLGWMPKQCFKDLFKKTVGFYLKEIYGRAVV